MSKYKVGDKVWWQRWPNVRQVDRTIILGVIPKHWWQRQQRYIVDNGSISFPYIVKEKYLLDKKKATP